MSVLHHWKIDCSRLFHKTGLFRSLTAVILLVSALYGCQTSDVSNEPSSESSVAESPAGDASASPDRPVTQAPDEAQGLVEEFVVTTPGDPLPPQPADAQLPGQTFPDLGREHIPDEQSVTYNSNPPTSGPHASQWAKWGIYSVAPSDRQLVHNLEHGGVVISYDPTQIKDQTLQDLRSQVRQLSQINPRIVLTPREDFEGAIALTAWGYLQTLDSYDADAVKAFYDAHSARGPECVDGQCPG